MKRGFTRLARGLVVTAALAFAVEAHAGVVGSPATADVGGSGTASADGMRVEADDPGFTPLGAKGELAIPSAQAAVSGAGSIAYAAAPHPGDPVIAVPGLVSGQTGVPAPSYPLYVSSSFPTTPEQSLDAGAFNLTANSTETTSTGRASGGGGTDAQAAGRTAASAKVTVAPDGTTTSEASGTAESVNLGDVLHLGRVIAIAKSVRAPGGEITRTTTLEVEGATVAGQSVKVTPRGLELGSGVRAVPASALQDVLAEHGITITYLAAKETDDGVVAPGLVVTVTQASPGGLVGTPVVTYTFGRAAAFAASDGAPTSMLGDVGIAPDASSDITDGAAADVGSAKGIDVAAPTAGTATGRRMGGNDLVLPSVALGGRRARAPEYPMYTFYLALVVAAAASFGSGQLLRILGVRR